MHASTSPDLTADASASMPYHCPKCRKGFDNNKRLGGHARHCKGEPIVEEVEPEGVTLAAKASGAEPSAPFIAGAIVLVPLECLADSPTQPRTDYNTEKHEELVASMRAHGWVTGWAALVRPIQGAAAEALPVEPNNPEGPWALYTPGSRAELFPGRHHTQAGAEALVRDFYSRRFELIAGHRRKRAARAAGIEDAPCVVADLDDATVIELQLVENLRRQDLNPIEEADALARLLALRVDGKPVHSKATLAAKVAATVKHVEHALSLCVLDGDVREAVADGRIGVTVGYELARIPDARLRGDAAAEILNPSQGEGPMRRNAALDYIRRTCTRNLRTDAKFPTDDAELVPVQHRFDEHDPTRTIRSLGGSCLDCPFNGANSDDPSRRGPKLGICANIACFDLKTTANFERFRAKHNKPDAGRVVVPFDRQKEIFDPEGVLSFTSGLVPLNAAPDAGLLKSGAIEGESSATWGELVKGQVAEVIIAQDPKTGRAVELVSVDLAKTAAEENGHSIFRTSKAKRQNDAEHEAATLAKQIEQETQSRIAALLLSDVAGRAEALGYLPTGGFASLCFWAVEVVDKTALEMVARRRKLESAAFADLIGSGTEATRLALLAELIVADHLRADCADLARDFAALFGVRLGEIRDRAREEVEREHAPKRSEPLDPNLPANALWRARRFMPSDQFETGFLFDDTGRCTNPDALEVLFPAKVAFEVMLEAALLPSSVWGFGYTIQGEGLRVVCAFGECTTENAPPDCRHRFGAFAAAARLAGERIDSEEKAGRKVRQIMQDVLADLEARAEAEAELTAPALLG